MTEIRAVAPVKGRVVALDDVADPVFASKKMGEGFAVADPASGDVLAPVAGKVIMAAKTGHAVGIQTPEGLQFLIHLGIDTVELDGAPFDVKVAKGDEIAAGDVIATMDVDAITSAGKDTTAIVIITNSKKKLAHLDVTSGPIDAGAHIATATMATPDSPASATEEAAAGDVVAPVSGTAIELAEVKDDAFASGKMGLGFAIADPASGDVLAPVAGKVIMAAKTGHAVGIQTPEGLQFLIHLGIDTVELDGAPFDVKVAKGDEIAAGDVIATMDVDAITSAGKDTTAVIIVTNSKKKLADLKVSTGRVFAGEKVAATVDKQPTSDAESSNQPKSEVATTGETSVATREERPADLTGFDATAWEIINGIGGADNVRSVTHCITRVRFYLKDEAKADDALVSNLDGVIDVVKAGGQYQVVIGADVEDVYVAVEKQLGGTGDANAEEEVKERPTTAWGWFKYGFSELIGVITGSMIPIIGLLAASGIIKGILSLLLTFDVITESTNTYAIINAMSDAVFYFLPIFVGFTAARRLGADPVIVAIIGGVLTYPDLLAISEGEGTRSVLGMPINADFFGLPFHLATYTYSIFPIIVAAWVASRVEPWLKKVVPNMVRMIFVPLFEVVIVSLIILFVLGPIVMFISTGIANTIQGIYDLSPTVSGLVIGGFYQALVIFGLHWAVIPLVAQDIASAGNSYLNAIISATMVAQGGAVLAVFLKTKLTKLKGLAGPAAISAFCGITEPAMYGVNLKYGRVFIMASIGGAVGGLLTGLFNVNMWGFTGSLIGFSSFVNPEGLDFSFWGYLIASGAALVVSFTLTYFFGFKDSDADPDKSREVKKVRLGNREPAGTK